ncbi:GNAT family N-acetyltransferase [Shuttleworthella sp. MSX8B]|uniref:GNAT family N-acetyltransferase n=1 Tax=Shuttleworthella sp. MSX8B TaxID=936574 RepID=UPI0012EBDCDF
MKRIEFVAATAFLSSDDAEKLYFAEVAHDAGVIGDEAFAVFQIAEYMASAERAYWFGEAFQGQGIMPEAVKEMLRHRYT